MDSAWSEHWGNGTGEAISEDEQQAIQARDRMVEWYAQEVFGESEGDGYPGGPKQRERDSEILEQHHNDYHDGRFGDRYLGQTTTERGELSEQVEQYFDSFGGPA